MATVDLEFELKLIRETLHLSVAETARLFGVSRPTWQSGQPISSENAERIREIAQALDPHLPILQTQSGRVAQRAIDGQSTLLELLAQGVSARSAIDQLAELLTRESAQLTRESAQLTRESAQRERLAERLRGRIGDRGAADLDAFG